MNIIFILFLIAYFPNNISCESLKTWSRSSNGKGDTIIRTARNGLKDTASRWPEKTVCYQFSGTFTQAEVDIIYETVNTAFQDTCVKIIHCDCNGNYVKITNDESGCFTDIGYLGGVQLLNLGVNCVYPHIIMHMFLHILGFYHQQNSPDRSSYIKLLYRNIDPEFLDEFNIPEGITTFNQTYDYCSIVHYDLFAFSKNRRKTMEPLCHTKCDIGFASELSQIDKNKINLMYKCGPNYPIVYQPDPCHHKP